MTKQREIKFRLWNTRTKVMWYGGFYLLFFPIQVFIDTEDGPVETEDEFFIMQFTGILDKSGKEIYEGDIVEGNLFFDGGVLPTMGAIKYNEEFAGFCIKNEGGETLLHNHDRRSFKIIGNIYENEGLLHD